MTPSKPNPKVDWYFEKPTTWRDHVTQLRELVLSAGLTENLKWGVPCYSLGANNIVLIHTFKNYSALLFFKGSLLDDPQRILIQQTKNVQVARQLRFTDLDEIISSQNSIKAYVHEAIAVEISGRQAELKPTAEFLVPYEFEVKLLESPALKQAFDALTPGRQRAYLLYFAAPKQSKTRTNRIDKYVDKILDGIGLNDEYGSSKK